MPELPKDHKNPGTAKPSDAGHGSGVKVDAGIKVTAVPRVPPGRTLGLPSGGTPRDVTANNVASQGFGTGLPKNVNK